MQDISWDEEYDVIVVGAGLAGVTSAITVATEGNGASCLLLEKGKSPYGGGNSQFSAGTIMATCDATATFEYLKALRAENPTVSDEILETYANSMAEHADWLRELGTEDFDETWVLDDGSFMPEYPELCKTDEERLNIGALLFNGGKEGTGYKHPHMFLADLLDQHEDTITRKTEAPAQKLIQNPETKEILGVTYGSGKKTINAKANKGVIMCCGGFENNPEMMANYIRAYNVHPLAGISNTGDGIKMCAEVGANMWHMANIAAFYNNFASLDGTKFTSNAAQAARAEGIIVGLHGRRYYMDNGGFNNKNHTEFDLRIHSGYRHGDNNRGGEWAHQHLPSHSWFIFDQVGFEAGAASGTGEEDPVATGWGYSANTVTELAELTGVPANELEKTVMFWNEMCDSGEDLAFYRFANTMNKIATPPFYAMKMVPYFLNTDGGPERSAKGEILDLDKNPIPHLYSAGEFGSIWSDMYNAGGNLSEAMAFGRISARNCLDIA